MLARFVRCPARRVHDGRHHTDMSTSSFIQERIELMNLGHIPEGRARAHIFDPAPVNVDAYDRGSDLVG